MQELETGTLYFDTSGKGYLPADGLFVAGTGKTTHARFAKIFSRSSGGKLSSYNPVDIINKLVAHHGLVVVSVPRPGEDNDRVSVISRSKKSALDPAQTGRLEDMFNSVTPNQLTAWADRLNLDGSLGRDVELKAAVSIFGSHEYSDYRYRGQDAEDTDDDAAQREFNKTVRPVPVVRNVQAPPAPQSSAQKSTPTRWFQVTPGAKTTT